MLHIGALRAGLSASGRTCLKFAVGLLIGTATFPSAAAAVLGELHSAYELGKAIWSDLQESKARQKEPPPGFHVYGSLTSARTVRTSLGDALQCASVPCVWVVAFYYVRNSCQEPVFFHPEKLQIEVGDARGHEVTLENVAAFTARLGVYAVYKWEAGRLVPLTQITELRNVLRDAPVFRDMTAGGWIEPGSSTTGYNVYGARQIDSLRLWEFKYRDHFSSDASYIRRGESHIGACQIYFHPQ